MKLQLLWLLVRNSEQYDAMESACGAKQINKALKSRQRLQKCIEPFTMINDMSQIV